jgi:hypothetical protein
VGAPVWPAATPSRRRRRPRPARRRAPIPALPLFLPLGVQVRERAFRPAAPDAAGPSAARVVELVPILCSANTAPTGPSRATLPASTSDPGPAVPCRPRGRPRLGEHVLPSLARRRRAGVGRPREVGLVDPPGRHRQPPPRAQPTRASRRGRVDRTTSFSRRRPTACVRGEGERFGAASATVRQHGPARRRGTASLRGGRQPRPASSSPAARRAVQRIGSPWRRPDASKRSGRAGGDQRGPRPRPAPPRPYRHRNCPTGSLGTPGPAAAAGVCRPRTSVGAAGPPTR